MQVSDERVEQVKGVLRKYVFVSSLTVGKVTGVKLIPPNIVEELLREDRVRKFFVRTFTHVSAGETHTQAGGRVLVSQNNYEGQELPGDSLANLFVIEDIRSMFGNMSIWELNNMLSYYKSNEEFGRALKKSIQNIDDVIVTGPGYTRQPKMYGDVMEALIMAVCEAGNDITPGYGYACARNVFTLLMRNTTMNEKHAEGHPKTKVTSIAGEVDELTDILSDGVRVTVKIRQTGIEKMRAWGRPTKEVQSSYSATAGNMQLATYEAYSKLRTALDEAGLTLEARDEARLQRNLDQMGAEGRRIRDLIKNKNESLTFSKRDTGDGQLEYRLIATNIAGQEFYIGSVVETSGTHKTHEAHKALLRRYLEVTD